MSKRSRRYPRPVEALVATLGHEPQVVTIALDRLLAQEYRIREVLVVHTDAPAVRSGLEALHREFASGHYPGIRFRPIPVEGSAGPLEDFRTEEDVVALLRVLYRVVRDLKRTGTGVHLSLAGGRKVMGVAAMVVAQLLFGPEDRVWHLLSEGWAPGRERRMHPEPGEAVWLVPVPVLRWTDSGVMLAALADLDDPVEAIRRYEEIVRGERMRRRREFVERWLTKAERDVARLACQGLDNAAIARRLGRSPRTVANQLSAVYDKLEDWLGFAGPPASRALLLAELAPYFALAESLNTGNGDRSLPRKGTASHARGTRNR
ncbi:MAG: CRISPR-associated protein Csx14 [Armatimonadetes bacterium]|nr:CRISPR-associated protein Csx14 [Armatimonadota bacterium]MDW8152795.1 CRISPR-associated protein Csx14 [Armatimonadota bacterium]